MISIVLIEPKTPGNIGAIVRAMSNFNFKDLVLINPKCDHLNKESLDRATHAKLLLKKAKVKDRDYLNTFDYLIGTSARLGRDYNISRSPLTPEQLGVQLDKIEKKSKVKIAILFGREDRGLMNEEISLCDFIVSIPVSKKHNSINLSHAVSLIIYEISKEKHEKNLEKTFSPAKRKEKEVLGKKINEILDFIEFQTKEKKQNQQILWKKIIGKSFLTKREMQGVFGFFKKIKRKLEKN